MTEATLDSLAAAMLNDAALLDEGIALALPESTLRIRSNSAALIERLREYFSHVLTGSEAPADLEVIAVEQGSPDLGIAFEDWKREPGKAGRKDSIYDFPGGRLVRKVRTGMVFLQSLSQRIAAGPCLENDNQVINFINAQYMNELQNRGWLICHAAALVQGDTALAIAGLSGGGKSTLMLRMLEQPGTAFVTNDRLFIKLESEGMLARGIPKMPRINPGTIVHNSRLQSLIPADRQKELLALSTDELWSLEEKFDAPVEQIYGDGRVRQEAPLAALLVLNWERGGSEPTQVRPVDADSRPELLAAVMKSPGPFYQNVSGDFLANGHEPEISPYRELLRHVRIFEATGGIDFEAAASQIRQLLT